jgi:myo-inositol-1(or 4)-monophosphatase
MGATPPTQVTADPAELLALALDLATSAAAVLRDRPDDLGATSKSTPTDVVTVMDKAAERVILDGLAAARPDDAIVSEESPAHHGDTGVQWLVDPLDGTVNYFYGIPHYSVSIAAQVDHHLVAGVVYDVERAVAYTATAGGGAFRDGERTHCSSQTDLGLSLVGTGFNYDVEMRREQARAVGQILPAVRDIRRAGSAALDLCAVACGQLDAFYESGMHSWDWAAGALIAREAGARVGGLRGRAPGHWTTLAANPALFDLLHTLLAEALAD